jgi:hypothetical protein
MSTTLVYCCLVQYFLVRICTVKCFTNSSKQFWRKVMFENEHMLCSWIHYVSTCTAFVQLTWAVAYQPGWPWLECHGGGWESLLHGGEPVSDLIFVPQYMIVVRMHFKWYSLYIPLPEMANFYNSMKLKYEVLDIYKSTKS